LAVRDRAVDLDEHGPTAGLDGPSGDDEVNEIVRGGNYGWPTLFGPGTHPGFIDPITSSATRRCSRRASGGCAQWSRDPMGISTS
jgi:Glucose / Sorbosone dehydrogenase